MAVRPLCDVEEEKAEEALKALEDATDTLRQVLNDVFRRDDDGGIGRDDSAGTY